MEKNKIKRDPLPASFKTVDEFVKFWDTHDTEDYPEAWREIPITVNIKTRRYPRILLEPQLAMRLNRRARAKGVSLSKLVNELLKETLQDSAH